MNAQVYIEAITRVTEKAILVKFEHKVASGCYNNSEAWLPKSQISGEFANWDRHVSGELITMPYWLANKLVEAGTISRIDIR